MRSRRKFRSIWRSDVPGREASKCKYRAEIIRRVCDRGKWFVIFLLPSLLGVSIFVLIPFGDVVHRSFVTSLSDEFCGLDNYVEVLNNQAFRLAVGNTLRFVAVCLPLLIFLSLLVALAMQKLPFLEHIKSFYLLPMAMPAATVVLVWRLVFARQGFLSGILDRQYDFLEGDRAFWVLIATYVWKNLGYTVVLWLAALKTVPRDIMEAAKVDGAGSVRILFHVTLPYLKGAMYTISLLSFLNTFKVFREVYLISGAYPGQEIYLLQHVFHNWYTKLDLDKMAAGAVLAAVVLGTAALFMERALEE